MENRSHTEMLENISKLVAEALANSMFTACSLGFLKLGSENLQREMFHFGTRGVAKDDSRCDDSSVYDLASLTKPLVVSLSIMSLCEAGKLSIADTLDRFFEINNNHIPNITVYELLNHCSGLPAHRPFYEKLLKVSQEKRRDVLVNTILGENYFDNIDKNYLYSDLGYILLGSIIEKVTGEKLSTYWFRNFSMPLELENDLFFPLETEVGVKTFVSTGTCLWSNLELSGKVNDDNCRVIGGVSGHAGLFGSLQGVLGITLDIMNNYAGKKSKIEFKIKDYLFELSQKPWVFGFDTPAAVNSTSGKFFSKKTIGHLGFTGTSFWLDLENDIAVVLLTNRVLLGGSIEKMKSFRQNVHDEIMLYLKK